MRRLKGNRYNVMHFILPTVVGWYCDYPGLARPIRRRCLLYKLLRRTGPKWRCTHTNQFKVQEDNKINTKKLRVTRDMKRAGSMRRRRRVAGSRAYIVGARYYHGNMLMSTGNLSSRAQEQGMALRTRRDSSRVCL